MRATQTNPSASTGSALDPSPVTVRTKISAAWAAMLFVFAYVDLFSLYRPDVRADLAQGLLGGFPVGGSFLLATTMYIAVPSLMVVGALVLPPGVNRIANLVLSGLYAVSIVVAAIGEWGYYLLGSALEVGLLATVGFLAWTWPRTEPARHGREGADTSEVHGPRAATRSVAGRA